MFTQQFLSIKCELPSDTRCKVYFKGEDQWISVRWRMADYGYLTDCLTAPSAKTAQDVTAYPQISVSSLATAVTLHSPDDTGRLFD